MNTAASGRRTAVRLLILSAAVCLLLLSVCPALLCTHDCAGTGCPVCGLVSLLSRGREMLPVLLSFGVLCAAVRAASRGVTDARAARRETPVSLCTRLLN